MADTRGFLTETDRAFLQGETEYDSKQGRYKRRQAIRERTQAALRDFTLLYETLDEPDREQIFEPLAEGMYHPHAVPGRGGDPPAEYQRAQELRDGIFSMIAFSYLGLWNQPVSFTDLVEAAVFQTERDRLDRVVDVDLTITEKDPQNAIESAIAKLETGSTDDLTHTETQLLVEFLLDPEAYPESPARRKAIGRLNELDPFAIATDDERSAGTEADDE